MYALKTTEDLKDIKVSSNCKEFGDTCVFILNISEFINRITRKAKDSGLELIYAPVEYHDINSFHGNWSVFKKPSQYSYQSEFRFFIKSVKEGPLILELGPIKDISAIAESSKIETLKVTKL